MHSHAVRRIGGAVHALLRLALARMWGALPPLPGDSRRFGPPRGGTASSHDWWQARGPALGARRQTVWPGREEEPPPPLRLEPELHPRFVAQRRFTTPETAVLVIPNGRVVGRHGAVVTPDDVIVRDVSLEVVSEITGDRRPPWLSSALKLPRVRRAHGTIAVLSSLWSDGYYHWLYDVLPRLEILRRAGHAPDRFVINAEEPFQRETLVRLGVAQERWIEAGPRFHLEADVLLVPSLPGEMGTPTAEAHEFLRRELAPSPGAGTDPPRRRLYVSRQRAGRRHLSNEPALWPLLEARGFERVFVEGSTVEEQARLFQSAAVIVTPHGAALSNLVFCRPGALVIELFSPRYLTTCYWIIAAHGGLRYGYVLGESDDLAGADAEADIRVSPARLGQALDAWLT